ncbi:hypothetical protein BGZ97_007098, partial [Linnemannia gamsii]
ARNFVARSAELNQPVVVVAPNYRLSVFGFLASKEMQQEMDEYVRRSPIPIPDYDQSIGNWGLQDQKLAFEWVRENISALGGNARNVTAWGESAGSLSLHYHMLIPSHYGLFDHAIMQSGVVGTTSAQTVEAEGQAIFDKLLAALDIPADLDGLEKVKRLRAVSMDDLSIMIGSDRDEGSAFGLTFEATLSAYPGIVKHFVPIQELVPLFQTAYGIPQSDAEVRELLDELIGDMLFQYPIEQVVETLLEIRKIRGADNFQLVRYHYNVELNLFRKLIPSLKAFHAGELPIIFGPPLSELVLTESEFRLSSEIQRHWISFAYQRPITTDDKGKVANVDKDEAIVWTEDHRVEVGRGCRVSKDVQTFWEAMNKAKLQRVQQILDNAKPQRVQRVLDEREP